MENNEPAPVSPSRAPVSPSGLTKALCLVGLGLFVNAGVSLYTHGTGAGLDISLDRAAFAQALNTPAPQQLLGARGIYMMPAQLGPQSYGLYLMDVDSSTICVYKALPDTAGGRLHFMAARSFKNDRFMEDYNNDALSPADVAKLVKAQRERQDLQAKNNQSTVDTTPRPPEPLDGPVLPH